MKRTMTLVLALALALPAALAAALYPPSPATAATDNLPAPRMARLVDFHTVQRADGRRLMRFSSIWTQH